MIEIIIIIMIICVQMSCEYIHVEKQSWVVSRESFLNLSRDGPRF